MAAPTGYYGGGGGDMGPPPSLAWRTRDMAHEILSRREAEAHMKPSNQGQMPMSSHFDVDTCSVRIRRDKAAVVRNSFEAGAVSLLEKLNRHDHTDAATNDDDDDDDNLEDIDEEDLPPIFNDIATLQAHRDICLEKAYINKDPSKRKIAKLQQQLQQQKQNGTGMGTAAVKGTATTAAASDGAVASSALGGGANAAGAGGAEAGGDKGPGKKKGKAGGKGKKSANTTPKFTRNTPASSAAALDARLTSSRAILCTAANVVFEALTPSLPGAEIEVTDVPQNPNSTTYPNNKSTVSNMGAVVVEAQTVGQRIENVADNASRRAARRYQYRKENVRSAQPENHILQVKNPFAWNEDDDDDRTTDDEGDAETNFLSSRNSITIVDESHKYDPCQDAMTVAWVNTCRPRMMSILQTGVGHAIYHDVYWTTRHGRIANMLQELAKQDKNFGLHLIVTVEPDVDRFAKEFRGVNDHLRLMSTVNTESLRALKYTGTPDQKKKLRKRFNDASGLPESPFHVIIASYADFLKDYLHFCQVPFEVVVMDDGAAWMAAAIGDSNSPIGTLWDGALWSKNDHQMGLAGSFHKDWDFTKDEFDEQAVKEAWIGLTARHRVLTSSNMQERQQKASFDSVPVSGLVNFVIPHYADATREEWDRSRITTDANNMKHFRRLLTRSTVVHDSGAGDQSLYQLALKALRGELPAMDSLSTNDPDVPKRFSDEDFVHDGKIAHSRRGALQCLGRIQDSWLRYELGSVSFKPILNAMKASTVYGHLCEEIVTASSTTSSGATGQVTGTLAYRLALRCGRHFGSEQGLRQHHSALHAPPGTWLCRTCSTDCVTSQARTHHERSCGQQNSVGAGEKDGAVGAPSAKGAGSSKGKNQSGPAGVVGKKNKSKNQQAGPGGEEKDEDGSIRVPGYRGVWANKAGKYFVKIEKKRVQDEKACDTMYFDSVDEAAKKHDAILKETSKGGNVELNFKEDGSRIVYEDVSTSSTSGLGGSAASVVPALSVINIKDLPPDVKPLLRDPRQTSRTGGNSKRHVYAYRGVCRQARKGHDRWQSQISFMGVNHYLGTFDSEWDAAAIYAWAHLILYGEEATRQAQKEGEEAAAAYEQEKRDIAEGKIPAVPPKPEKKKGRAPKKKSAESKEGGEDGRDGTKKKRSAKDDSGGEKKKPRGSVDKESLVPVIAKSVSRAATLGPRAKFAEMSDDELSKQVAVRLLAVHQRNYCVTDILLRHRQLNYGAVDIPYPLPVDEEFRPCTSLSSDPKAFGGAMLLGLSASLFGWSAQATVANQYFESEKEANEATEALEAQYGEGGFNENFRTVVQGTATIIGCASSRTQRVYRSMGLGNIPVGGAIGNVDCNIGGSAVGCSETAAVIRYMPTQSGEFQFSALADDDVVTMNGQRITPDMGSFPLFNEDICTVGPRVFVFLLPADT